MSADAAGTGFGAAVGAVVRPSDRRGGTLRLCAAADVDSLDPGRTYHVWGWMLQRALSRTLLAFPADPGPGGRVPVPDLATGPGRAGDGGRTWTYDLRPGIRYDDGRPVTSADVRHAVARTADPALAGGPTHLRTLLRAGPVEDAVLTPSPHRVVFRLERPCRHLDHLLTLPCAAPLPVGDGTRRSGPYRVARHVPGRELELERNPCWDRATDPLRPALPDRIRVTIVPDVDERDARLLAGEFHADAEGRGVQPQAQARILADPWLLARADNPVTGFLQYISIQTAVPPFGDLHARRAVCYAADKRALLEARGGPVVGGDLATTVLPPTFAAHVPHDRYPSGPDGTGDLGAARRELALAGLPDGFSTVVATQRGKFRATAEALARSLARVGIDVRVEELPVEDYYLSGPGCPATVRARGLGLVVTDWGADFPDEYGFYAPLVDSRRIVPSGNFNLAELADPRVDALLDRALDAPSDGAALEVWRELDRLVMEHAVMLPMVFDRTLHHRDRGVANVLVHPAFGLYDVQAMGLAEPGEPEEPGQLA